MKKKKLQKEKSCENFEKPTFAEFLNYCQQRNYWICLKEGEIERFYKALEKRNWKTTAGKQPKSWQTLTSAALNPICGDMPSGLLFVKTRLVIFSSFMKKPTQKFGITARVTNGHFRVVMF